MDDKTLHRLISHLAAYGPYVMSAGAVRQKNPPRQVLKMRRATLLAAVASGHVEIVDSHVRVTTKGRRIVANEKTRSADYVRRLRTRGCVRKSVWVHPDDVERFEAFVETLRGPST